jgi:hypothetical protein
MESIQASPEAVLEIIIQTCDAIGRTLALIAQTAEAVGRLPDATAAVYLFDGLMENRTALAAGPAVTVDKLRGAYRAGRAEERAMLAEWAALIAERPAGPALRVAAG